MSSDTYLNLYQLQQKNTSHQFVVTTALSNLQNAGAYSTGWDGGNGISTGQTVGFKIKLNENSETGSVIVINNVLVFGQMNTALTYPIIYDEVMLRYSGAGPNDWFHTSKTGTALNYELCHLQLDFFESAFDNNHLYQLWSTKGYVFQYSLPVAQRGIEIPFLSDATATQSFYIQFRKRTMGNITTSVLINNAQQNYCNLIWDLSII